MIEPELIDMDSREIEEADFSAFRLQEEDTREALDDLSLGWGRHHASDEAWNGRDDSDGSDLSDYVPSWA